MVLKLKYARFTNIRLISADQTSNLVPKFVVINEIWIRKSDGSTIPGEVLRGKGLLFGKINPTKGVGWWAPSRLIPISCSTTYVRASFFFYTTHGHQ